MDQNFTNNILKGSPNEQSCEVISSSGQQFQRRRILKNFFKSIECKKSPLSHPPMAAMFFDGSKFHEQLSQGTILQNYSKFWSAVSEEKNFKNFLKSIECKKSPPPPPQQPCFSMDQNFTNSFWKGPPKKQSCEIILNSDQWFQRRRILKHFFKSIECKKSPPPQQPCFSTDQTFTNNFWKGSSNEQSSKLFQILISGFKGEELWTISLSP